MCSEEVCGRICRLILGGFVGLRNGTRGAGQEGVEIIVCNVETCAHDFWFSCQFVSGWIVGFGTQYDMQLEGFGGIIWRMGRVEEDQRAEYSSQVEVGTPGWVGMWGLFRRF